MSWDSYIENLIAQSTDSYGNVHADRACIIGLDGSKWTTDDHPNAIKLSPCEAVAIGRAFKKEDFSAFMANLVQAEGLSYTFLREMDKKVVFAKFKGNGALTLQRSKTAVIIGHTAEGSQQGTVNVAVARIADYLELLGL